MKLATNYIRLTTAALLTLTTGIASAQADASAAAATAAVAPVEVVAKPIYENPVYIGLTIVAFLLLVVIAVLSSVLKGLGRQHTNIEIKKHKDDVKVESPGIRTTWVRSASVIALLFMLANSAMAQSESAAIYPKPPNIDWLMVLFLLFILFEFVIIIVLISSIKKLMVANGLIADAVVLAESAAEAKVAKARKPSFMQKWLTRAVPIEQEKSIEFDHEYDGIRELDNSLPPWWLWGFYISIVFGIFYLFHYHVLGTGSLSAAEYNSELVQADLDKEAYIKTMEAKGEAVVNEENVTLLTDASSLQAGAAIFKGQCAACHAENGGGKIGPNLTDEYWIYGGSVKNLFKIISNGTPNGMTSWKGVLSGKDIQDVASYVKSLKGSNPAGGLPPKGDIWKDEEVKAPTDSTAAKQDTAKALVEAKK